jgi:hypothetical protein
MSITVEQKKKINDKFFQDPDWAIVEQIILDYIEPLKDITTVDITEHADTVKAQVAGRKIAYEQLHKFLREARLLNKTIISKPVTFK